MAQRYAARALVVVFVLAPAPLVITGCAETIGSMPQLADVDVRKAVDVGATSAARLERMFAHYPVDMLGAYWADTSGAALWADSILATMSLSEKAAQLVIADFGRADGSAVPPATMRAVSDLGVGGILLPRVMDPHEVRSVAESLQREAAVPLLIAADYERGAGRFSSNLTELPSNMAIGATRDTVFAAAAGRLTAIESRALGVNLLFAPVADVNTDPQNPIINTRAYGDQPDEVAANALAFSAESERWGLLTTLKHFPGHGDTAVDTHTALATVAGDREELDANGLWPFAAASAQRDGPAAIMTAHVWVPALDSDPLPATFSDAALRQVLRGELGYGGLVITDDIRMGALSTEFSLTDRVVRPVQAGADIILTPEDVAAAVSAIEGAVRDGVVPEQRVDQAARRVLLAKGGAGLHRRRFIDGAVLDTLLANPLGQRVADSIAAAALTWWPPRDGERRRLADMDTSRYDVLLHLANYAASESIMAAMDSLEHRVQPERSARSMPDVTDAERLRMLRTLAAEKNLLVVLYMRLQSGRGAAGLHDGHRKLLSTLVSRRREDDGGEKSLTIVVLGDPYTASSLPAGARVLLGYDQSIATTHAVADVLAGRASAPGRLPVTFVAPGDAGR